MNQVIYKYPFEIEDRLQIEMPLGSRILFIEKQRQLVQPMAILKEQPCMWVMVDPTMDRNEIRTFEIVGTGHEFELKGRNYIGSLMMNEDRLLWHMLEIVVPGAL